MRATFTVPAEDTLLVASARMRENGAEVLPIVDGYFLRGVVTENSLAKALAEGALDTEGVEVAFTSVEPTIHHYETGAEALRRFDELQVGSLVVVDDDRRVVGILRASDLITPPKVASKPAMVGGMATPFGVYLTSGVVRAGPGDFALVTTGIVLSAVLFTATILSTLFGMWLVRRHVSDAVANIATDIVQLGLFAAGFRLLPLSGIHAAEHMVVHAIERGEPLIPSVVRRMPRVHPRCGTNLATGASIFMGIALSTFVQPDELRLLLALVCTLLFWRRLGGLVQYWITTRPPSEKHIRMGIRSAEQLLERQQQAHRLSPNIFVRLWNSGLFHVSVGSSITFAILLGLAKLLHWDFLN